VFLCIEQKFSRKSQLQTENNRRLEGKEMRYLWLIVVLIMALASQAAWCAAEAVGGAGQAPASELHPLFAPSAAEVEAAVRLGEEARRAGKTVEELLDRWSLPAPNGMGKVVVMAPAALIAEAAYEAVRLHKSESEKRKAVEDALAGGKDMICFQVWLKSKGSSNWLWPYEIKSGDKTALQSISFVLSDGKGHFYQPMDPDAKRKLEARTKRIGSPVSVTVYPHLGSFYISIPVLTSKTRTDFVAKYDAAFSLWGTEDHRALIDSTAKVMSLRIIGARGEKQVDFQLADLQKIAGKSP
jgi:hypothetical protein